MLGTCRHRQKGWPVIGLCLRLISDARARAEILGAFREWCLACTASGAPPAPLPSDDRHSEAPHAVPSRSARSRKHPRPARGGRLVRQPGDDVFGGQGQLGAAASAAQGLRPRQTADPAAARGHALEVPRDDRLPRPPCRRDRRGTAYLDQSGRRGPRHQPDRARRGGAYRRDEDPGPEAGAGQVEVRRGHRRCAPRRGKVARQGAHFLVPQRQAPLGPQAPAAGAVEPLQHPHPSRRERARVPRCPTGPSWTSGCTCGARRSRWCRCISPRRGRWWSATAR